ncbi:MAG: DMT family transporter, partial [Bacteroidales bacterium]|nr:DMT family transporter [Bacteroidales bacterium]
MKSGPKPIALYILLLISMALWGASFVWGKIALESYSAFTVIFFRLFVSVIVLLPVLLISKNFKLPSKENLHLFILLAFFEPFLYFIGETNGLKYIGASMTSIIISVIPLFTPFVAYYFLKEKVSFVNLMGIIISISGIMFLVFDKNMNLQVPINGLILLLLSVVAANGYSVM